MNDDSVGLTPVFGIDLGTTNTCIARISPGGSPEVVQNIDGDLTTPSVVFFENADNQVVGLQAIRVARGEPEHVCSLIKRKMGQSITHKYRGEEYTPESISALILRKVIADALQDDERPRDERVKLVITVPAYFNSTERNSTKVAGALADAEVLYLADEPIAAAIAYGFGRDLPQNFVVYDLGGGTFDVTVVRSDGESAQVVAKDGVRLLGGHDWDTDIVDWVKQEYEEAHPGKELPVEEDLELKHRLYEEAEQAKKALSVREKTVLTVHYEGESFAQELTRVEFEEITAHLLEQTLDKTEAVIEAAKQKGVEKIDKLLLVGGSSRMPAVKRSLLDKFGYEPIIHDPDLVVAKGAARLAQLIEEGEFIPDMTGEENDSDPGRITMVNSKGLGVEVFNKARDQDIVTYLIPKNTDLPAKKKQVFGTLMADQKHINLRIFEEREEPSEDPSENTLLHQTPIDIPGGLPEGSPIEVEFRVDEVGILHVFIHEPENDMRWEVKVEHYKEASDEDIMRLKPKLSNVE